MSPARKKSSAKTPVKKTASKKRVASPKAALPQKKGFIRRARATSKSKTALRLASPPVPAAPVIGRPLRLEHGTQPLEGLMTYFGLTNAHLVNASTEQITFKMVHKARGGRHLTPKVKTKILNALHNCLPGETFAHRQLFNY